MHRLHCFAQIYASFALFAQIYALFALFCTNICIVCIVLHKYMHCLHCFAQICALFALFCTNICIVCIVLHKYMPCLHCCNFAHFKLLTAAFQFQVPNSDRDERDNKL